MNPRLRSILRATVGLGLATAASAWIVSQVDLRALRDLLDPIPWAYIAAAIAVMFADFGLRATRWFVIIRALNPSVRWTACATALFTATALNNLVPLRMGDVVRTAAFPRLGAGPARIAATLIVERILDVWTLLGITIIAVHILIGETAPKTLLALMWSGWVFCGLVVLLARQVDPKWVRPLPQAPKGATIYRVRAIAYSLIDAVSRSTNPKTLAVAMLLSIVAWALEGAAFAIILAGTLPDITWSLGWVSMGAATLATMIPAAPGFIGTFHAAAMQPIVHTSADTNAAVAFALLAHAVVWGPVTLVGSIVGLGAWRNGDLTLPTLRRVRIRQP